MKNKEVKEFRVIKDYHGILKGADVKSSDTSIQRHMIEKGYWLDIKSKEIQEQKEAEEAEKLRLKKEAEEAAVAKALEDQAIRDDNVKLRAGLDKQVEHTESIINAAKDEKIKMQKEIDKENQRADKAEKDTKLAVKRADKAEETIRKNKAISGSPENK